eukprot:TRINITY_DN5763_c0_g1_i2.p1 TRINITY_DN5763_c0_g1~~TRINITY_DN5763_c0_g1_i2.p1  ORF type:complete len:501 (+),score=72.91 TRINITY_DN5763_c0_g1_i2:64-1566(+)
MFGGGSSDATYTTHQSGASRLCNSLFAAVCLSPCVLLIGSGLAGYNEKRAVCTFNALHSAEEMTEDANCDTSSAHSGSPIFGTCKLQKQGLQPLKLPAGSDFDQMPNAVGVGLRVEAKMYCCVEEEHTRKKKDVAGGGETTEHFFSYKMSWVKGDCTRSFKDRTKAVSACGPAAANGNPAWPSQAPRSSESYVSQIKVGAYSISDPSMIRMIGLNTPLNEWSAPPNGQWSTAGAGAFSTTMACAGSSSSCLGQIEVKFFRNDWRSPAISFAGLNTNGEISKWTAPDSWLCFGQKVGKLKEGEYSRDEFFKALRDENTIMTWALRACAFLMLWAAFYCCVAPFEVLLDCIPCVGPYLGDCFDAIACCVSCVPATVCFLGVAGVMWAIMRPFVGIPLLVLWFLFMCVFGGYAFTRREDITMKAQAMQQGMPMASTSDVPSYGTATVQPTAQPPAGGHGQMQVACPPGSGPGDVVAVVTPSGQTVQVTVPAGVPPGGVFLINY